MFLVKHTVYLDNHDRPYDPEKEGLKDGRQLAAGLEISDADARRYGLNRPVVRAELPDSNRAEVPHKNRGGRPRKNFG